GGRRRRLDHFQAEGAEGRSEGAREGPGGDPRGPRRRGGGMTTVEERLFAKIMFDPADPGGGWLWVGATARGCGRIWRDGRLIYAHRATYELYVGSIPPGMLLDHTCHIRNCVRPDHLRIATNKQNGENRAGAQRNSRSGVRGVFWDERNGRW